MTNRKRFWNLLSFTLFIVGFLVRLFFLPVRTMDMGYYLTWYNHIVSNGVLHSLSDHFIEYNPPFIYLLSLATLTKSFLPRIWAIKFIPITFDIINTGLVFQITKTYFDDVSKSIRAALIFWAAPTIMINSSVWGQTDSLYAYGAGRDFPTAIHECGNPLFLPSAKRLSGIPANRNPPCEPDLICMGISLRTQTLRIDKNNPGHNRPRRNSIYPLSAS